MSEQLKINVARVGGLCFIVVTLGGLGIWLAALPVRLEAAEKEIQVLKHDRTVDHEMISRIDERTKWMAERMEGKR